MIGRVSAGLPFSGHFLPGGNFSDFGFVPRKGVSFLE
jgi:hypothetical protein